MDIPELFDGYGPVNGFDEMFADADVRSNYRTVHDSFEKMGADEIRLRADSLASSYLEQGVTFGVAGEERPFPLDIVPRLIEAEDWQLVEKGVRQRVLALERFLADAYGPGELFADGVVPRATVMTSPHYHRVVSGLEPPNGVRVHVAGVDLIRDGNGDFRVLEDNVRVPSGVSYVMTNRRALSAALPEVFADHRIRPVSQYSQALLAALRKAAPAGVSDPTVVVLTPGVYNSAYFEHTLLARTMGVELVEGRDLVCRSGRVMMRTTNGLEPVHVIYRRIDDEFLDPVQFRADSALGVPGIINAARAGHVTIANAVGNGVADDKLLYTYVPDLIRYYLSEEPILRNVDTWRMGEPEQREEVLDRLGELVLKPVDGSGGKGIVIGPAASKDELEELRGKILLDPRAWIAQPVISLSTVPTLVEDGIRPRHVDLRPFAVHDGDDVWVLPGGLTRVALPEGELIVNSSRGGGSKDTWVLASPAQAEDEGDGAPTASPVAGITQLAGPALDGEATEVHVQEQEQQQGRVLSTGSRGDGSSSGHTLLELVEIAQSLFWIGRYLERADDTARILDVQMQVLIEDPGIDERRSCEQLLSVMGVEEYAGNPNRWLILDLLAHNADSPVSIAAAIGAARESARRARETLSTDIWAAINTTWRGLSSAQAMRPPDMFNWVRNRTAMISGIADSTMSRDEGWQFYMLGRSIERVDMTARLLSTAALASGPQVAWPTTLRACGAYESFIRAYRGIEADRQAAEFLLLDRWFPRSIVSSLAEAERALNNLEATGQRSGFSDEAQRLLGRARTELEYRPLADIVFDLPVEMERLQRACAAASDAVSARYFAESEVHTWRGGVLL